MKTLCKGSIGQEVTMLQNILRDNGYPVYADGIFGNQTHVSVCLFQKQNKLKTDGIVGSDTWKALNVETQDKKPNKSQIHEDRNTTEKKTLNLDFKKAAHILNVDEDAIRAVHMVEAGGSNGFLPDGRPIILFEGHIFWNHLKKLNLQPEKYVDGNEDILFPKWNRSMYKGGAAEHERLNKAIEINRTAALRSASWGMFQIMGFNHHLCGYQNVDEFVQEMKDSSNNQLMAFIRFMQNTKMDLPLRKLDWTEFARKYNGPAYAKNQYDKKLELAFKQIKKTEP